MSEHGADKVEGSKRVLGRQMGCIVRFMVCFEKKCMSIGILRGISGLDCSIRLAWSSRKEARERHNVKLKSEVYLSRPVGEGQV